MIIDGAGLIREIDMTLDNITRLTGNPKFQLNVVEFERLAGSSPVVYYDSEGEVTDDVTRAVLKIIKLTGIYAHSSRQVCLSFIKFDDRAKRFGDASDEAWCGAFVGDEVTLYEKWCKKYLNKGLSDTNRVEDNAVNTSSPFYGLKTVLFESAVSDDTLSAEQSTSVVESDKDERLVDCRTGFLNEVYDLLYLKESWKKPSGSLMRLEFYFKHLALRIINGKDSDAFMIFNSTRDRVAFNSRLLNKYGSYIIVACQILDGECTEYLLIRGTDDLKSMGFCSDVLKVPPVSFFERIDDVVFRGTLEDFELYNIHHLTHVIEERRDRLPVDMHNLSPIDVSIRLNASINMAVKIAQTDYKFIIPMWCQEKRKVQFLIPVYTSFDGLTRPECALVIDKNDAGKWEIKTVLDLEWAYSNARLINRPDQNWLVLA